ncbi:sensor histidine kinase [Novosphingobium sp.]|uniref:sensor histidine kinase n=1 Tax=Novosphingobium sp. TaxID=1874826 RepID=UPI002FDA8F0F
MHFDDRLETVLRLPDSGDGLARVQYLQLIDLLGRVPARLRSEALEAGFSRLNALAVRIPAPDRQRLLRQIPQPITNSRLLSLLARDEPGIASTAIAAAHLTDAEWLTLIPELPVRARGILRHRRDLSPAVDTVLDRLGIHDRGLPPVSPASSVAPEDPYISGDVLELLDFADAPPAPTSLSEWAQAKAARELASPPSAASAKSTHAGIGAIVRRIEEFRKARQAQGGSESSPEALRLPLEDVAAGADRHAAAIDFATDAQGRINWADGVHAPSLTGLHLAAHDNDGISPALATAIRHHLPLDGAQLHLTGAPAVAGGWQIDAVPLFDPGSGRFSGYSGRLRRLRQRAAVDAAVSNRAEAERMREVLHELRTPANAIQVAAEIIQQQLYGPAPHEYRALAAAIASDCAHILAGFEELDRLVKLETGALGIEEGECDLAQVLAQTIARLRSWTDPRRSGFAVDPATGPSTLPIALDEAEVERLIWRLFAALAGATAPDEALGLSWSLERHTISVRVALPGALVKLKDGELFDTSPGERAQSLSASMFGIGFSLRLAAAEASAAGGGLQRVGNTLHLWLPGLTRTRASNSKA